jgi:hypothetical protein
VLSHKEVQVIREELKNQSLDLADNIQKSAVKGYGIVYVHNGSAGICRAVEDKKQVHNRLIDQSAGRLEVELNAIPYTLNDFKATEGAFILVKRGECGAIYAASDDLATLLESLARDKLKPEMLPIWFSENDIENETRLVEEEAARQAAEAEAKQKVIDENKELANIRDRATGKSEGGGRKRCGGNTVRLLAPLKG